MLTRGHHCRLIAKPVRLQMISKLNTPSSSTGLTVGTASPHSGRIDSRSSYSSVLHPACPPNLIHILDEAFGFSLSLRLLCHVSYLYQLDSIGRWRRYSRLIGAADPEGSNGTDSISGETRAD